MGLINRKDDASVRSQEKSSDGNAPAYETNINDQGSIVLEDSHHHLHRGLKGRQVAMIAIGGAVGTGLIIGTGSALKTAGPAAILIGYTLVGFLCFLVMAALGEMAAWLPLPSGFSGYAHRFVDPALGFSLGWTYWFKYIIVTPNNLTAASLVLQYWVSAERINPGVWIAIFLVLIVAINYFGVSFFGEFEFWLSTLKVIVIVGLIILSLVLALGGGPDHDRKGFRYWDNPGAFNTYLATGAKGRFLAVWSTLTVAVFAYLGTELVGVTVGEAQNPRRAIPRAIKLTFYRILLFYVFLVFLLGMIVPYNSPELKAAVASNSKKGATAAASPFVVAIQLSGIKALPAIFNACVLLFVLSAANSDLYIASRTLFGLAHEGNAPKIFAWTDRRGVPVFALGLSSAFCLLAFMGVSSASYVVFGYFTSLVTIFGLLTWISILTTHIFFVRARKAQNIPNEVMPYVAPLGMWGSVGALFFSILIAIFRGFDLWAGHEFNWRKFITTYLGIPLYLIMIFGYKLIMKSQRVRPEHADFYTGKQAIDDEESEFLENEKMKRAGKPETLLEKVYRYAFGWLF